MPIQLACLSPEEMRLSLTIGHIAAGFGVAVALAALAVAAHRRSFRWLPFYAVLLAVHPTWTVSIYRGDCGDARRFLSGIASLIFVAMLLIQIFRPQLGWQRFLVGVCALAWVLYLPLFLSLGLRRPLFVKDNFFGHIMEAYTLSYDIIALVVFALSIACVVLWMADRFYARRTTA